LNATITVSVDPEIVDLAERFLKNRRAQAHEWRTAVATGDTQALRRLGHELKGTAGAFGLHSLSSMAVELENAVAKGNLAAAGDALERMIEFLDQVAVVPH